MLQAKGVDEAVTRLQRVGEFADQVDFPTMDRLIDPGRTAEEFAAKRSRWVQWLHAARNTLAVAPLLITWLALSWASIDYSKELHDHPERLNKPFLLLWQQHFGGRSIPTFAFFGALDLGLLGLVFVFTIWVHYQEDRLVKKQTEFTELIDSAMVDMAGAISGGLGRAPVSAEDWANSAGRIITEAMEQTRQLSAAGREVIEQASKDLARVHTEGRDFIITFSSEVNKALSAVQDEYQDFMRKIAGEVAGIIEQQFEPLLDKFGGLVTEFGQHHETYRTGVAELTKGVSTMSHSAEALAVSARDHAQVGAEIGVNLAKVAESQRDFADQVAKNVTSMDGSAKAMESTAEMLRGEIMTGLKDFTGNVVAASKDLKSVQGGFKTTTAALSSSSKALDTSSAALGDITRELRVAAAALSGEQVGFWRRVFGSRRYAGT